MQVALPEVNNPLSVGRLYVGISDVPLLRHGPVENRRSGRYLESLQGNSALDHGQRTPDSVAGNASANRVKLFCESVQFLTDFSGSSLIEFVQQVSLRYSKSG